MRVVLVADGDVIEHVLLPFEHAPGAVVDDGRELVAEARVVGAAIRHRRRGEMRRAVLVLQALARQRGAPGGAADEAAARAGIGTTRAPSVSSFMSCASSCTKAIVVD